MARRKVVRRFAGSSKDSRRLFWLRLEPFFMTERENSTGTFSDILAGETDWYDPSASLNESRRGGARLERVFLSAGANLLATQDQFTASGEGNFGIIIDSMLRTQSDQFATTVVSSALFSLALANDRVLAYGTHHFPGNQSQFLQQSEVGDSLARFIWRSNYEVDVKAKARLTEKSIAFDTRFSIDLGDASVLANQAWVQPTMLISLP